MMPSCAPLTTHPLQPVEPRQPETKTAEYRFRPLSPEDSQRDFVTLVSCANLPAADVIVGRLQATGIEAFIPDDSAMQLLGSTLNAFGYVRVQIAPKDYETETARDLLSDIYDAP